MADEKHAVVTGGAGFIGSHLVESLLADGYRVTVLDNFATGRRSNLDHVESAALSTFDHDVKRAFPPLEDVGVVYHLASRASPVDFRDYALDIAMTNAVGTRNALSFAADHDSRFVLASTSEVYGDPEDSPQDEAYNGNVDCRGPRAPYDEGKRFGETISAVYARERGLDVRTARIFNTYGPRMQADDGRVIPTFLRQALAGNDLTVHGDGSQTRSFCYVDDLVAGLRALDAADPDVAAGEAFNLGSEREITIRELAQTVLDVTGSDASLTYEERPPGDPDQRRPDCSKAREVIGWSPEVDLEDGLQSTREFYARTELA